MSALISDKMAAICDLVSHFLCNVKVADYSITHQVGLQVAQLMQDTATIIEHLLKALVKQVLTLLNGAAMPLLF